jgi:Na+-driven multidrug efflux pump
MRWRDLRPDPTYIQRAFRLGLPGSIELSTRGLGLVVMSFFAASFGTLTTAAYGVGSNILQIVTIPAMGISMAVATLVGQNMGAGNVQRASRAAKLGASAGFFVLTLVGGLAWLLAPPIVAFFVPHDPGLIAEGARFIRIMCLAWGGIGIQLSVVSTFRASGNMVSAMMIAVLSQWCIQFPVAYVLSKHTGLHAAGLWWSFTITNLVGTLGAVACFADGRWKRSRLTDEQKEAIPIANEIIVEEGVH